MDIETPACLYLPDEIVAKPCPVPTSPGVYGWYFRKLPGCVPVEGCISHEGSWLLYVGISPRRQENAAHIRENLRTRIRYHLQGNAEGSTLRRTLGCLLQEELGIALRRVGSGKRLTFSTGEKLLSEWMRSNMLVCWQVSDRPWELEDALITRLSLPLNLAGNQRHSFCARLKEIRAKASLLAKSLPVLPA
jgi:hypothetical protein